MPQRSIAARSFGSTRHNHRHCIDAALGRAATVCGQRGARLTDLRQRVLELVWRSHAPIGAYRVLEELRRDGRNAAPPTVYRALDFLLQHGLIHRIESLNAFVGCTQADRTHVSQFLICTDCNGVAEIDDPAIGSAVARGASAAGFVVNRLTIEMQGQCPNCSRASHAR
ncbi:MAG: Fur family transcriptional regulator [Dongiaceae bacterium]